VRCAASLLVNPVIPGSEAYASAKVFAFLSTAAPIAPRRWAQFCGFIQIVPKPPQYTGSCPSSRPPGLACPRSPAPPPWGKCWVRRLSPYRNALSRAISGTCRALTPDESRKGEVEIPDACFRALDRRAGRELGLHGGSHGAFCGTGRAASIEEQAYTASAPRCERDSVARTAQGWDAGTKCGKTCSASR
jgi:hypothetical protein